MSWQSVVVVPAKGAALVGVGIPDKSLNSDTEDERLKDLLLGVAREVQSQDRGCRSGAIVRITFTLMIGFSP
jgi:hypothetical protein